MESYLPKGKDRPQRTICASNSTRFMVVESFKSSIPVLCSDQFLYYSAYSDIVNARSRFPN